MNPNKIPNVNIAEIAETFGTPSYLYDLKRIETQIKKIKQFDVVRFAQKACSNIAILSVMRKNGVMVDAVSAGEVVRAVVAGYQTGEGHSEIVYTADMFDNDAVKIISKYKIPVNVGSSDMITQLGAFAPGTQTTLRINPGFGHGHSQKVNTGGNLSKHGIWFEDIQECIDLGKKAGVNIHGLHMHIGSGSDFEHLSQVCESMVEAAKIMGSQLEVISTGGGLPIAYQDNESEIDVQAYYELWDKTRKEIEGIVGHSISLEVEPGRFLVAQSGTLITQIRSIKNTGGNLFYVVDAGFDTLLRPAMYGAYHDISIVPQSGELSTEIQDVIVAGPLCESCDVFTQSEGGFVTTRPLPKASVGDYLLLHDAGAYGAAMSSNYNTRRLAVELLFDEEGVEVIRERQTIESVLQFERIPDSLKKGK